MTANEAKELELELEVGLSDILGNNSISVVELSLTLSGHLKVSTTNVDLLFNRNTLGIYAFNTKGDFLESRKMVDSLYKINQYLINNRDKFKLLIWSYHNIDKVVK